MFFNFGFPANKLPGAFDCFLLIWRKFLSEILLKSSFPENKVSVLGMDSFTSRDIYDEKNWRHFFVESVVGLVELRIGLVWYR